MYEYIQPVCQLSQECNAGKWQDASSVILCVRVSKHTCVAQLVCLGIRRLQV